jgi:hypothetical protein
MFNFAFQRKIARKKRLAGLAYAILGSSGEQQYVARYRPSSPFVTNA